MSEIAEARLPQSALDALQDVGPYGADLPASCRELIRSARMAGASWDEIGEALGTSGQSARSYYTADIRARLAANVEANADLDEGDAMALAVAEVKAVRRERHTN